MSKCQEIKELRTNQRMIGKLQERHPHKQDIPINHQSILLSIVEYRLLERPALILIQYLLNIH